MPTILLIGEPAHAAEFSSVITTDFQLFSIGQAGSTDASDGRIATVSGIVDLPSPIDAIVDLGVPRSGKRETLAAVREIALPDTLVFVNSVTMSSTEAASHLAEGTMVAGISYLPSVTVGSSTLELAMPVGCTERARDTATSFLHSACTLQTEVVEDRVGLVSARILAMVINEAAFALMERVADAADIDVAMKLGTSYPEGPLAWCDRIGADHIVGILDALHQEYLEERYRACVLLRQYARAQQPFISAA